MTVAKASKLSRLDPTAAEFFYRQIYDRFRGAIASGLLKPSDRIPSARALTTELGLARGTIEAAYSLLAAEGYIQARGQAGTIVTPGLKPRTPVASPMPSNSGIAAADFRPDSILPFQMGLPALDVFRRKIWARLGARCVRAMQPSDMVHPSVLGLPVCRPRCATIEPINQQDTGKDFVVINRINYAKASPEGYKAYGGVYVSIQKSGLPKELVDLGYPRMSQINGCAYCIDMHSRDLLKSGIAVDKLVLVPVWRDAGDVFTPRERSALAWAETVTRVAETGVPDADYEAAAAEFSDKELADLTYAIGLMNAFNRLGISFRTPPAAAAAKA